MSSEASRVATRADRCPPVRWRSAHESLPASHEPFPSTFSHHRTARHAVQAAESPPSPTACRDHQRANPATPGRPRPGLPATGTLSVPVWSRPPGPVPSPGLSAGHTSVSEAVKERNEAFGGREAEHPHQTALALPRSVHFVKFSRRLR